MYNALSCHPLYTLLEEMYLNKNNYSDAEATAKWAALMQAKRELQIMSQEFETDFTSIKKHAEDLETTISQLHQKLDEASRQMPQNDRQRQEELCEIRYKKYWDKLNPQSKEFLITGHYLYSKMQDIGSGDYSPVILEFCRVIENELLQGIYMDFIESFSEEMPIEGQAPKCYLELHKAVQSNIVYRNFFLSAYSMLGCIGFVKSPRIAYAIQLYAYLEENSWDINRLSDRKFVEMSQQFVADYRGKAAHPNTMNNDDAKNSAEKTKKIVSRIVQSRTQNT